MTPIDRIVTFLAALTLAALAPAQKTQEQFLVPIPEKLERATEIDDEGLVQWSEYEAERCVNCKGRKTMQCQHCLRLEDHENCPECQKTEKAPCRICAGTGEMPDILARAPCPSCFGASVTVCMICRGAGRYPVAGGGKKLQKCGCCKGVGGYPCVTCDGKRFVETPKLKPSVGEAKPKDLKKALESLDVVIAGLETFESVSNARKDYKAYAKLVAPATRYLPPLKRAAKQFETASKRQTGGAVWTHYAETVVEHFKAMKQPLDYYLRHQRRLLELCITRAEVNAEAEGKKKLP